MTPMGRSCAITRPSRVERGNGPGPRRTDWPGETQVLDEQPAGDAGPFEDHRQPAAGMGAAADQVDLLEILEPVARPVVQHLPHVVGEVEGGAAVDLQVVLPVGRRDDLLEANAPLEIVDPQCREPAQDQRAIAGRLALPVDAASQIANRHQDVERAVTGGRLLGIGDAGVLHVERGRLRRRPALLDGAHVAAVVLGKQDRVVRQVIEAPLDAEVHHEGRARIALLRQLAIRPAAAQSVGHQTGHGLGEIGVDDERIAAVLATLGPHADRLATLEDNLGDGLVEPDRDARPARDFGHGLHHRAAAAARMEHPVLVLHERQDGEQARALERRHAEILGLEREGEPHPRVREVAGEIAVDAAQRTQRRAGPSADRA